MSFRKRRQSSGFSLIELLMVMLLMGIIVGAMLAALGNFQKFFSNSVSRTTADTEMLAAQRLLSEDITNGGKGTVQDTGGPRLIAGTTDKVQRPCCFISDDDQSLYIIKTTPEEVGHIAFSFGTKLVLTDVNPANWTQLVPGNVALVLNSTGLPSMFSLSQAPFQASEADFPAPEVAVRYDLSRSVVLLGNITDGCGMLRSLSNTILPGAAVTPIISFVKYYTSPEDGLVRDEYTACDSTVANENHLIVALLATTPATFSYVTTNNPILKPGIGTGPPPLNTLRGINVLVHLEEPGVRGTLDFPLQILVKEWN